MVWVEGDDVVAAVFVNAAAECSSRGARVSPYSNSTEGRRAEADCKGWQSHTDSFEPNGRRMTCTGCLHQDDD